MLKSPRKIAHRMTKAGYVQVPHPRTSESTGERWTFRKDSKVLRSRYAFVKAALAADRDAAHGLVRAHGEAILARS
jgi:hypothetical protein